jgi:hypothetical protein
LATLNQYHLHAEEPSTPNESVEVRNCVKLKSGKARLIDSSVKKCKKNEKLVFLKFPAGFIAPPSQPGPSGTGVLSGKGIPKADTGKNGDFYIDLDTYNIFGPKNEIDIWGEGKSLVGPQGPGGSGPRGPAGITTLGYNGYFIDDTIETFLTTAKAIPFNTTVFGNGVTIANNSEATPRKTRITFANSGKYNIQFSSQLFNQGKKGVVFTLWLSKNGDPVADSSTDVYVGTSTDTERHAIAWNFFVDAAANDWFELTAVSSDSVQIYSGASQNVSRGAPDIPGTILTVNQVG